MIEEALWTDGWDWMGMGWMGMGWMVIIGHRQSKVTFGANNALYALYLFCTQ